MISGERKSDGKSCAIKVFKAGKSVSRIRAEMDLQVAAVRPVFNHSIRFESNTQTRTHTQSELGLAPEITSSWTPNGTHRCFAMERMKDTLEDILKKQDNVLTVKQAKRILDLYVRIHI